MSRRKVGKGKAKFTGKTPAELAAVHKTKHAKRMKDLSGQFRIKAGTVEGSSPYPDGTSVAAVAVWMEFGTIVNGRLHIQERPAHRIAMRNGAKRFKKFNRKAVLKIAEGSWKPKKALGLLGLMAVDELQKSYIALDTPPNKDSTKDAKGSSNPLIDTGHLLEAQTYQIIGGDEEVDSAAT